MEPQSPALRTLVERGFVHQATDMAGLDEAMSTGTVPAYVGFDLTAPSLHVGSMVPLMAMRHLRRAAVLASGLPATALGTRAEEISGAGVEAVHMLLGDATTRVGDPTGRTEARPVLDAERIRANWPGIRDCVWAVAGGAVSEHFNSKWLDRLSFMDFLTGPARMTSLNRLVATDVVAKRLVEGRPMTLMELVYQTMQGMDFAHLARERGVRLQIGGSDQWTNIIAGVDLARRTDGTRLFGLTLPLLVGSDGRKMGKSSTGTAVWLHPDLTSSFDLWQFWRNVADADVGRFLGLFTDLPMDEVRSLAALDGSSVNEAKAVLATEATAIAHGREAALDAAERARSLFSASPDAGAAPRRTFARDPRMHRLTIAEVFRDAGLASSLGEARRLAAGGGLRIAGRRVSREEADQDLDPADLVDGTVLLGVGKRRLVVEATGSQPILPVSAIAVARNDGLFDVVGEWEERDGSIGGTDLLLSGLQEADAVRVASRVRLAAR